MTLSLKSGCYANCGKKAAKKSLFCSSRCAANWAEELARGNEDEWCPVCGTWGHEQPDGTIQCGHPTSGITEGMSRAEAAELVKRRPSDDAEAVES